MRDSFPEFYRLSREDVKRFITEAIVVVDANVLLELYRLGTSQRGQVLDVLDKVKDRLWLPYQAGKEYQVNRLGVVTEQAVAYDKARSLHGVRDLAEMKAVLKDLRVPSEVRDEIDRLLSPLCSRLKRALVKYEARIDELTHEHVITVAQAMSDDPVRGRLDILYSGRSGQKPDAKIHEERVKEAMRRIQERIPPGYKDSGKDSDERKAGDYLIWAEILDYAEVSDKSILFVTKDSKEDWFERRGGQTIGPRVELLTEFAEHSKHGYHQVTLGRFLDLANEFLSAKVEETTIQRVSAEPSRPVGPSVALSEFASLSIPAGAWPSLGITPEVLPSLGITPEVLPSLGVAIPAGAWPSLGVSIPPAMLRSLGVAIPAGAWPSLGVSIPPAMLRSLGVAIPPGALQSHSQSEIRERGEGDVAPTSDNAETSDRDEDNDADN